MLFWFRPPRLTVKRARLCCPTNQTLTRRDQAEGCQHPTPARSLFPYRHPLTASEAGAFGPPCTCESGYFNVGQVLSPESWPSRPFNRTRRSECRVPCTFNVALEFHAAGATGAFNVDALIETKLFDLEEAPLAACGFANATPTSSSVQRLQPQPPNPSSARSTSSVDAELHGRTS
jgi:hypothetical protein